MPTLEEKYVSISSQLGWYDLLSVVRTDAVLLTQQQGRKFKGPQPHSPTAAPQTLQSVERGKRKPWFGGNSLFL